LYVGTSVGGNEIYDSGSLGSSVSATVSRLPTDGSTVWVRLWYVSDGWQSVDFQYTATGGSGGSSEMAADEGTGKGTALVSWNPPTNNTDGSTITDLAGFKIYYGRFPGEYDQTITINNSGLLSYLVENLASSDWFFVMTAFNKSGIESAYSAEMYKEIK
jgi:hypothetical protein